MRFTASALLLATITLASGSAHGQVILYSNVDGSLTPQSAYYSQPSYLNSSAYGAPVYVPSSAFNTSMMSSSVGPLYVNSSSISPSAMATASALIQACEAQGIDPATLLSSSSSSSQSSAQSSSSAAAWQVLIPLIPDIVDLLLGDGGKLGGGGGGVGSNARLDRIEKKLDLLLKKEGVETGNGNGGPGGRSNLADLLAKLIPILLDQVGNGNNGGGNSGGNNGGGTDNGRTEDVITDSFDAFSASSASSSSATSGIQAFAAQTGTSASDVQQALAALRRYQANRTSPQEADPEESLKDAVNNYEAAMKAVEEAAVNVKRQKILATTELKIQKLRAEADKEVARIEGRKPEKSVESRLKAVNKRLESLLAD